MGVSPNDFQKPKESPGGPATSPETQERIVEALVAMNAAIRTIRLYPPTSAMIANSLRRAAAMLTAILNAAGAVELCESQRALLINGQPLGEKNSKRPQVAAFLELMVALGIRSLTLTRGLPSEELRRLLELVSRTAEELGLAGGFREAFARAGFAHVSLDQKIYVALDQGQQSLVPTVLGDAQIFRVLAGEAAMADGDRDQLVRLARDPHWLARSLTASVELIRQKRDRLSSHELTAALARLVDIVERLVDRLDKPEASRHLAMALRDLDRPVLEQLACHPFEGQLGQALAGRLNAFGGGGREPTDAPGPAAPAAAGRAAAIPRGASPAVLPEQRGRHLPEVIAGLYRSQRGQVGERVLLHLAQGLNAAAAPARAAAADTLVAVGEKLLAEQQQDGLERLVPLLTRWVAGETQAGAPYGRVSRLLGQVARTLVQQQRHASADQILETYQRLATDPNRAPDVARQAAAILRDIAGGQVLEDLLAGAAADSDTSFSGPARSLSRLLVSISDLLLDRLRDSEQRSERVRLIKVLSELGTLSPRVLVDRLRTGGPWYFIRNLVVLLARVGQPEHLNVLTPLLTHADIRVRLEAINAIYQIGGERREATLIDALARVDDRLRLSIVAMLGAMRSDAALPHLLRLLEPDVQSGARQHGELDEKICVALGRIGSVKALPALQAVAGKKGIASLRSHGARVRQAAAEALEAIRIRHETRVASSEALPTADDLSTAVPLREEEEIDRLLREKQPAEAAALLLERVIAYAGAGEFDAAERLRERLEAMRPLAVAERVRADEAIAAARAESGAQLDLRHFDAFCETLSPQEASAFIEALQPLSLAADESAVRQGEIGLRLLLVLSGELKVTCLAQDRESLIQVLGPGEIAGWEGCGAASVATAGIAAITRAEVAVLTCEVLEQWERSLPDLRRKLVAFCERFESVSHALASKGLDRRRYRRYPALIDTQAQLLGDDQRPTGKPFSAQLTDISAGGASLQFRVIEPRMGRLLLGRWLQLQFDLPGLGRVAAEGRVVAARPLAEGKLQLHVMFRQPLPLNDSQDT